MGVANEERQQLSSLLDELGPDAPTLCDGWTTKEMAVHLVMRERRPDALAGKLVKMLAARSGKVEDQLGEKPWGELVDLLRQGPPKWNPLGLSALDEAVNSAEFYIHHEDVRRAQPGWVARESSADREEALWKALAKIARVVYGRSPVGVTLRRGDGTEIAAKRGPRTLRIMGPASELILHAASRPQLTVSFDGDDADVLAVEDLRRSL